MNLKVTQIISLLQNRVEQKELLALGFQDQEIKEAYRLLELMVPQTKLQNNDSTKRGRPFYGGMRR